MTSPKFLFAAAVGAAIAASTVGTAPAQPHLTRIRGTIEKIDGSVLSVFARELGEIKLTVAPGAQIFGVVKATLSDVKPNSFVGVGAMPQADGSQKAIQLTIFAESMRGLGEGFRPWAQPGSTMTNGTVDTTIAAVEGQVLTVRYKNGEQKIIVTPDSTIRAYVASDKSELKPGANISTFATKRPDGTFEASRVSVGRDGIAP